MTQIDTSGEVSADYNPLTKWRFGDLSPFTQGYIEAMLRDRYLRDKIGGAIATLRTPDTDVKPHAFRDLAPETLARIIADCEAGEAICGSDGYQATGLEFWKVRQAGLLAEFPPLTVQLGDDGKVRFA